MPEAPEVQTVLTYLEKHLKNLTVVKAQISHTKLAANLPAEQFEADLAGQRFEAFHRHGKYLVFVMSGYDWISHMRMEGKFLLMEQLPEKEKERKHIHAVFTLSNGQLLCYRDTRKFGRMYLYPKQEDWNALPVFKKIGLDALDPALNCAYLEKKAQKRCIAIKPFLLDQSVIAGIGNIYADEILFACRINPHTPSCHLDNRDWENIIASTRTILGAACTMKGTTIRSFSSGNHEPGQFQDFLQVHKRQDEPCNVCHTPIVMERIAQRSTYYCPHCQQERIATEESQDQKPGQKAEAADA